LVVLSAGAGILTYAAGIWISGEARRDDRGPSTAAEEDAGIAPTVPPAPDKTREASDSGLPDPASPLPSTREALTDEATRVVDLLVQESPQQADAWEVKARLLDWLGKTEGAVKCWEKCLELNPEYAYAYAGMGRVAADRQDHAKAIELLRHAVRLDPGSFPTRTLLAESLVSVGKPKEAVDLLEHYLRADPRSLGYCVLGQAYLQLQQYEKAKENLEAAIRIYPEYTEAFYRLATVHTRMGQKEQAARCMRQFHKLRSGEMEYRRVQKSQYDDFSTMCGRVAATYAGAARLYYVQGKRPEAEALLRRAMALAPKEIEPRQGLAWVCRQEGRTHQAIELLEELAKLEPKNPAYWLEIGRLRAAHVDLDGAEEAFRSASRIAPESPDAYAELAGLHLTWDRKLPEALALARTAVQRRPTAANHALLSAASERNGDHAGAVAAMAKAAELEPGNPQYRAVHGTLKRSP